MTRWAWLVVVVLACTEPTYTLARPRGQWDCKRGEKFYILAGGDGYCYQVPPDAGLYDAAIPDAHTVDAWPALPPSQPSGRYNPIYRNDGPVYVPSDTGPHCTKGCRCGNACIDCRKTCHK